MASMARTVADQFVDVLSAAGVKRIYGIVGDSLNGLTDSLCRQGKIECIRVWHEEVATFAAEAAGHLIGGLAACAGSCGPGNLHLINGLFDCHRARARASRLQRIFLRARSDRATSKRRIRN